MDNAETISALPAAKKFRTIEYCDIEVPGPVCVVLFGASGDLVQRKIMPSLYRLQRSGLLPENYFVLGVARSAMDDLTFRGLARESVNKSVPGEFEERLWVDFSDRLHYLKIDYDKIDSYATLKEIIPGLEKRYGTSGNRIFYLAVPPEVYEPVISNLGSAGLSREEGGYTHVAIEKPIGHDLESAKRLNSVLRESFDEKQIYRMDHYLAKETVQNILMFRFANSIFEPIWNRRYIDHVQISVSETVGVEHRAGYYDKAGVVRDMFQNHLIELLGLIAMEPPVVFEAERVRDEKVKVFRSIKPLQVERAGEFAFFGQYGRGEIGGAEVPGYREEPGVPGDSLTPTFAALKVFIDNWRWHGVPFYLRSGKRLQRRKAEVSIHFKPVPHLMFAPAFEEAIEPNVMVMKIQPEEGVNLIFQAKKQGTKVCLDTEAMDFSYRKVSSLSDYERILLDCMQGDQMLFVREDGVEQTWSLFTPLLAALETSQDVRTFPNYAAGSAGPAGAEQLLRKDGRSWRVL